MLPPHLRIRKYLLLKFKMKINRTYLFITISSVALLLVLMIQVNWIFETAKIKEEIFNDKAEMVLSKTIDALRKDSTTYEKVQANIGETEKIKIDSLLNQFMKLYDIRLDYTFDINVAVKKQNSSLGYSNLQKNSYQACLNDDEDKLKLNLKINFPKKETFILAEMKIPFFISVVLVLIVLVILWRTILSIMKEKKIMEQTNDFLNNMTHEFKTPITNIALATNMIAKDEAVEQNRKLKNYAEIIVSENQKLKMQVEQILGMTELERGEIPMQKSVIDLHELMKAVIHRMSLQIENENGTIHFELNADEHLVSSDEIHLNNAICNLLDNALKYSDKNLELKIQTSNQNNQLVISIADNGIGIEKVFHEKIFEKYFRVPTGDLHNVKGFGIGLAYTKIIIEQHGGTINLTSQKNIGTTFIITLPNA
ncbi:MAG: hypothetical protein RL065_603 [Bacteroidota bacterium]